MVHLFFIYIQHWGYLHIRQFLFGAAVYNYKGHFEELPCKPIIFLILNISTNVQYITWRIHLLKIITDNCPGTGNYFFSFYKFRKKHFPTKFQNPSNQLILCKIIFISKSISRVFFMCVSKMSGFLSEYGW